MDLVSVGWLFWMSTPFARIWWMGRVSVCAFFVCYVLGWWVVGWGWGSEGVCRVEFYNMYIIVTDEVLWALFSGNDAQCC